MIKKNIVFCNICGECLGEERPYYAKQHLKNFPEHRSFLVKTLYDPLLLDNPDEWFKNKCVLSDQIIQRKQRSALSDGFLHREESDKDFPEPHLRFCNIASTLFSL